MAEANRPLVDAARAAGRRIWLRDHALSLVFLALFGITIVAGAIAGWFEYAADQRSHGETPQVWGESGYLPIFLEQTSQNIQSEFVALAIVVVLSSVLIHKGSAHSTDGQDEISARVDEIRRRIDRLARDQQEA